MSKVITVNLSERSFEGLKLAAVINDCELIDEIKTSIEERMDFLRQDQDFAIKLQAKRQALLAGTDWLGVSLE